MLAKPAPVLIAGWLVPGAGHFLLGRRPQAVVFFLAVTATYLLGMFLADFTNVSPSRHPFYFAAYVFNGGETILATLLTTDLRPTRVPEMAGVATKDIGIVYTAVASLLNIIIVMDAWGHAVGLKPRPTKSPAEEPA
ncbi:MAG: DUF6677 family protein [Planctomycetota bacterium]